MLLGFLLVLLILVCIAMGTVILLQRSEGGALGMGGGPSGFMSARGAGDLLTRITSILGGVFFFLCLLLTILAGRLHQGSSVVDRLKVDAMSPDALNRSIRPPGPPPTTAPAAPSAASQFDAPAPEVHTAPAAGPSTGPATTPPATTRDNAAHTRASDRAGVQAAPQVGPTVAPGAAPPQRPDAPATSAAPTGGQSAPH